MVSFDDVSLPDTLLSHSEFLHSLAVGLLSGTPGAEDVVQDTWISAIQQPPKGRENLRGWLKKVATNHAIDRRRSEERRAVRETRASLPEGAPSAAEIVEQEELRRIVVATVLALEEHYRSALLLRYYEGLPPRLVARRLKIPVETVRTRIKRGLAQLRAELDRRYGERGAWGGVLLPIAVQHRGARTLQPLRGSRRWWADANSAPSLLTAACALLAVVWLLVDGRRSERDEPRNRAVSSLEKADANAASSENEASTETIERGALGRSSGEVLLRALRIEDRAPIARARLELAVSGSDPVVATSDGAGIARMTSDRAGRVQLSVDPTDRSLGWRGEIDIGDPEDRSGIREVLVPGAVRVSGRVMQPGGGPVAAAEVLAFGTDSPTFLDDVPQEVLARAREDSSGRFDLDGLPSHFALLARADGLTASDCFVAESARPELLDDVELVVGRPSVVRGFVVSADERPIAGATVLGRIGGSPAFAAGSGSPEAVYRPSMMHSTVSAADGSFSLYVPFRAELHVIVDCEGYAKSFQRWTPHLRFGAESLEITLVATNERQLLIETENGEPIAGAEVRVFRLSHDPWTAVSGPDGRVVLPDRRTGVAPELMARITAAGFGTRLCPPIRFDSDPGSVQIRMERGQTIRGRVLDEADPVRGSARRRCARMGRSFSKGSRPRWCTSRSSIRSTCSRRASRSTSSSRTGACWT